MVERGERVLFAAQNLIVVDVTTNTASLTPELVARHDGVALVYRYFLC